MRQGEQVKYLNAICAWNFLNFSKGQIGKYFSLTFSLFFFSKISCMFLYFSGLPVKLGVSSF